MESPVHEKCPIRAIPGKKFGTLAARIVRAFAVDGRGPTALVALPPEVEFILYRPVFDRPIRPGIGRSRPARVEGSRIVHAVDVEDWDGIGSGPVDSHTGAGHRDDGGQKSGSLRGQSVDHPRAIRMARPVDSRAIDAHALGEIVQEQAREFDVIDIELLRATAAGRSRVPGQQNTTGTRTSRIHRKEAFPIGDVIEAGRSLELPWIAGTPVERDDDGGALLQGSRHMHDVPSASAVDRDLEFVIAG